MTLTTADNKTLEFWFTDLQLLGPGSEEYITLRNKIYTYIYRRLMDMLKTKVYDWKRKYGLDEEDVISIFNDVLLRCVDKYRPKRVKFITYFWQSCENTAKNYYKKYRCQRRIPASHIFNVDFDELHNQAEIIASRVSFTPEGLQDMRYLDKLSEQLRNLSDKDQYQQEITQLAKDSVSALLPSLSKIETRIFEKVVEGYSISAISKLLDIKIQQVDAYISKIQRKASKVI
jgi:RNA polymerase sigma factor (sigma-70 family)